MGLEVGWAPLRNPGILLDPQKGLSAKFFLRISRKALFEGPGGFLESSGTFAREKLIKN